MTESFDSPLSFMAGDFYLFFVRELTESASTESRTKVFFEKLKIGFLQSRNSP
jgi:hypothetical protein